MADVTPSPVRQVRQFEADEVAATKLQQEFDDEANAAHLAEVDRIEDEFDRATRLADEERNARALRRMADS